MVQVVGQNPNFSASCRNCGAQLAFTRKDIRAGSDRDQEGDRNSLITCPQCRRPVDVTPKVGRVDAHTAAEQDRTDDDY
jgi:hypothetical protein